MTEKGKIQRSTEIISEVKIERSFFREQCNGGNMIASIGIDIVEIERIEEAMIKRKERFLDRLFTPAEQEYCLSKSNASMYLAGRFAAKEAVLKVLGTGLRNVKWTDIEIIKDDLGKPYVQLTGKAAQLAKGQGINEVMLSISHSRNYAVAQAVGIRRRDVV
jgi:holo-[acyl-carrier protein] synthase